MRAKPTLLSPVRGMPGSGYPPGTGVSAEPATKRVSWRKVAVILGAVAIGAGIGIGIAVATGSDGSSAKAAPADEGTFWASGARKAPDFSLRDQSGRAISLRSLRGRPVVITF